MKQHDMLTKLLALLGTLVVWLVLFSPVFFGVLFFLRSNQFHFDYLMPAELFPIALIGGFLLYWAALRAQAHKRLIRSGLMIAVVILVTGQAYAVYSGLASGETEPAGLPWLLVVGSLALYVLGLIITGWGGIKLLGVLYKK